MTISFFQVDAFTSKPFHGNPAAVCLIDCERSDEWMQNVASEMNLAETAFVRKLDKGFELRWFTPVYEVDLCGHATLASAHALWEMQIVPIAQPIDFHSRSGVLTASRTNDLIELDFPTTAALPCPAPAMLLESLGVEAKFVGRSKFDLLVEVDSAETLRSINPDFRTLKEVKTRGVIVTSCSDDNRFEFQSRFFAPSAGVDEDPVTGSAHCVLSAYWQKKLGKDRFVAFQASSRGGIVHVRIANDRTILGGNAVTVLKGDLLA